MHGDVDVAQARQVAATLRPVVPERGLARRMSSPGLSAPGSPEFGGFPPEFAAFLFAQICEEKNGMPLSVVSALARFGVDPWREAARLAGLPSTAAVDALAAIIPRISVGQDPGTDIRKTAARLVQLLPKPGAVLTPAQAEPAARPAKYLGMTVRQACLIAVLGAIIAYGIAML